MVRWYIFINLILRNINFVLVFFINCNSDSSKVYNGFLLVVWWNKKMLNIVICINIELKWNWCFFVLLLFFLGIIF